MPHALAGLERTLLMDTPVIGPGLRRSVAGGGSAH
jgi:hypothetical protein